MTKTKKEEEEVTETSQWYLSKMYYILQVQFQAVQKEGERGGGDKG